MKTNKYIPVGNYWARVEGDSIVVRSSPRKSKYNEEARFPVNELEKVRLLMNYFNVGYAVAGGFKIKEVTSSTAKVGCTTISRETLLQLASQL